jgi:uncharacterized protein YecT (DUF1311 family)
MKILLSLLLLYCTSAIALPPLPARAKPSSIAVDPVQRDHELHARAQAAVEAERARARQPLCPKAQTTLDINTCDSAELNLTDQNEIRLVRALGALLRSNDQPAAAPARIPFDDAESAWQTYRDLACKAAGDQYAGGTIRPSIGMTCRITIARHHMDELWAIYSDLDTH